MPDKASVFFDPGRNDNVKWNRLKKRDQWACLGFRRLEEWRYYSERMLCPLEPMSPFLQSQFGCQQFPVSKIIVTLVWWKFPGKKSYWMNFRFFSKTLGKNGANSTSEASISTTKGLEGSGCLRMGAVVNAAFKWVIAWSALELQDRRFDPPLSKDVRGWALELKPRMNLGKNWQFLGISVGLCSFEV